MKIKYKITLIVLAILLCVYLVLAVPAVTNNTPLNDTYTNDNTPTVNFTIINNVDVDKTNFSAELLFNNTVMRYNITNATNGSTKSFTLTANATIADGSYLWFISLNDTVPMNGTANTLTIDTVAPNIDYAAPTPANNSYKNTDSLYINATSALEIHPQNITFTLFNLTAQVNSTLFTMEALTSNNTINWTGLAETNYTYNITMQDKATNSNTTYTRAFVIDRTYPLVEFGNLTFANNTFRTQNTLYVNVSVTELHASNITFVLYNATASINSTEFPMSKENGNNTINWTGLADGNYTFNVTVQDLASNKNITISRVMTLDTTSAIANYGVGTQANNSYRSSTSIYVNASITELNVANITFLLFNTTGQVNSSFYPMGNVNANNTINWTGLPAGNYTYNYTVVDLATNSNTSLTRSIILDTTAPTITIEGPANLTTDTDGINFTYNVSDLHPVTNCTLFIAGSKAQVDTSITRNVTQSFLNLSLPVSDSLQWFVTCMDNSSNKGNSSVYIVDTNTTAAATATTSSSSTSSSSNTFSVGELTSEYEKTLERGEKVSFDLDGEEYKIKLSLINDDGTAAVYSYTTKETYDLDEGDSINLDLDEDGEYDVTVTCKKIDGSTATLVIDLYSEATEVETVEDTEEEEEEETLAEAEEVELGAEEDAEVEETGSKWWLWTIIAVVIVIIAGVVIFFQRKK